MAEENNGETHKKKRGRPAGTKNKPNDDASNEEPNIETKPKPVSSSKGKMTVTEAAALAEAEEAAAKARIAAAKEAAEAAAEEEYKAAAKEAVALETGETFTNKRGLSVIFRRELGEPEFWLDKKQRVPLKPVLSQDEEEEISRKVEIPTDQTPQYKPEHMLSPEFGGTSNYERGVVDFKQELEEKLQRLKSSPDSSPQQITQAEEDLKTLDYLYENFYDGMNVFRTAKGGRNKLRE